MHHMVYQPLLPSGNRYLQQKWDQYSYNLHLTKLKSARATIITSPPKTDSHFSVKARKLKMKEDLTMKILRENNKMMEKISNIMLTTGRVDNRNYYERKSLEKAKKKKELVRITKENQKILVRLNQCRPYYSIKSWEQDWHKNLKLMDAIARYPRGRVNQQTENTNGRTCSYKDNTIFAKGTTHNSNNIKKTMAKFQEKYGTGTATKKETED